MLISLLMETQSITDTLKKEFVSRCQRNDNYSMRAYARHLNVDHSLLAKILRGQKALSKKMAYQVGEKLGLSSSQIQNLCESSKNKQESNQISEDVFIMMSDWYHFAILELIKTKSFTFSPQKIAKTFGISTIEVDQAFERLQRLGFLIVHEDQNVELTKPNNNWFNHDQTSSARKIMQKQLLKKAIDAVDNVEFAERANSSLTISIGLKDLPKFKKHIQEFVNETDALSESINTKKENVYQLCVAFYPLSSKDSL